MTCVEGVTVSPDTEIYPCCATMPMGFVLSAYWTQRVHERLLEESGVSLDRTLRDHRPPPPQAYELGCHAIYLDNEGFLGEDHLEVDATLARAKKGLHDAGLPTHEEAAASLDHTFLGTRIDGASGVIQPSSTRFWRIRYATRALLFRKTVSGSEIEILLGHYTHVFLLVCPCLSVFRACYSFVQRFRGKRAEPWPQVRAELRVADSLLPLVRAELGRRWCATVFCSDAATHGYAIHQSTWKTDDVRAVGRWREQWRYVPRLGRGTGGSS